MGDRVETPQKLVTVSVTYVDGSRDVIMGAVSTNIEDYAYHVLEKTGRATSFMLRNVRKIEEI